MAKRKTLTPSLKSKIKQGYKSLRLSDYQGEARDYLKKVKSADKARKTKQGKIAKVGSISIPRDSEIYKIIEKSAAINKMSVAAFIKKHKDSVTALMKDGDLVLNRETDKLIHDINAQGKGMKVFINDGNGYSRTSKLNAIFQLQQFKQFVASNTNVFLLFFRTHTKLNGDIYFSLPDYEEYGELEGEESDIIDMMDSYFPNITYLRSDKKAADYAQDKKRKKQSAGKAKSKKGSKPVRRRKR